jgi:hypothetical protein
VTINVSLKGDGNGTFVDDGSSYSTSYSANSSGPVAPDDEFNTCSYSFSSSGGGAGVVDIAASHFGTRDLFVELHIDTALDYNYSETTTVSGCQYPEDNYSSSDSGTEELDRGFFAGCASESPYIKFTRADANATTVKVSCTDRVEDAGITETTKFEGTLTLSG